MNKVITNLYGVDSTTSLNDYIGFTFNKIHSSELGIVRTSDGSRFNENLLPTIQDKTTPIPGGDGTYFFGSYFTQRQFNIQFAFDKLTEQQFSRLKSWLGDKKIHELIFDETPYKAYYAKITGSATIKHIPFEEGETNRIYKGEGSIQFTAYEPYAHSVKKYLDDIYYSNLLNVEEWKEASGMLDTQGWYDKINDTSIRIHNPGDIESDFFLTINFNDNIIPATIIRVTDLDGNTYGLDFKQIQRQGMDDSIKINSKLNLIEGYYQGLKTGNVYNKYITAGDFFKIPKCRDKDALVYITIEGSHRLVSSIDYNYYYI